MTSPALGSNDLTLDQSATSIQILLESALVMWNVFFIKLRLYQRFFFSRFSLSTPLCIPVIDQAKLLLSISFKKVSSTVLLICTIKKILRKNILNQCKPGLHINCQRKNSKNISFKISYYTPFRKPETWMQIWRPNIHVQ